MATESDVSPSIPIQRKVLDSHFRAHLQLPVRNIYRQLRQTKTKFEVVRKNILTMGVPCDAQ